MHATPDVEQRYATGKRPKDELPVLEVWIELAELPRHADEGKETRVLVAPDPLVSYENQTIRWISRHPFSILFTHRTPHVDALQVQAEPAEGGEERGSEERRRYVATAVVRPDAASVRPYKYTVAVSDRRGRIHMLDPVEVVEKDPRR